jgi:autoinducer 2-degrading protein
MVVRIVTVKVKAGQEAAFEQATQRNHEGSVQEPGVLRFDVLKDAADPGTYYLYEVYRSEEATEAHKETAHYREWKAAVADMMDGPRSSVTCNVVAPEAESAWASG